MAGKAFIKRGSVGVGTQTTTERNAGVGTAIGEIIYNITENVVQVFNGTNWDQLSNVSSATGGDIESGVAPGNGFHYYVFTQPGTLTVTGSGFDFDMLVVGGGGGGGGGHGSNNHGNGGGGAGGIAHVESMPLTAGDYPVTVSTGNASGGAGTVPTSSNPGSDGSDSTVGGTPAGTITGKGGGGGGAGNPGPGRPGGSGSGGGGHNTTPAGSATQPGTHPSPLITDYGNNGGNGGASSDNACGGGGGGAGGGGTAAAPPNNGGEGGNGQPFPAFAYPLIAPIVPSPLQPNGPSIGPTGLYGGGGGGGNGTTNIAAPSGGPGGGGSGGTTPPGAGSGGHGSAGSNLTGGGGGGGGGGDGGNGGNGGSGARGIVIFRRPV